MSDLGGTGATSQGGERGAVKGLRAISIPRPLSRHGIVAAGGPAFPECGAELDRGGADTTTLSVISSPPFDHDPGTVGTPSGGSAAPGDILVGAADAAMTRKKEGSLGGSTGPQTHP